MKIPDNCFITNLDTNPSNSGKSGIIIEYVVNVNDKNINLVFSANANQWTEDENVHYTNDKPIEFYIKQKLKNIKHILYGIILNNKWPLHEFILNSKTVDEIIKNTDYPLTPKDKMNNLFLDLCKRQNYYGQTIGFKNTITNKYYFQERESLNKLYFISPGEFLFYLNTLAEKGLIKLERFNDKEINPYAYRITYNGLEESIKMTEEGKNSNKCFVAMSFSKDDDPIFFKAIKPACEVTGFDAKRIDYEHYDSAITINDAIISLLKQCKFCIADFTKQRNGVYFEAGYALGRGMKVIYTCNNTDFKESHFDTNHFPHIVYESLDDLKKKLIDKINAFIKD